RTPLHPGSGSTEPHRPLASGGGSATAVPPHRRRRYAGPRGHSQCPHRGTQRRRRAAGSDASGGFLTDEPGRPPDSTRSGRPFGFNAILGLIGLAGILMRNTLILTEQIKENRAAGLDDYHAVIEATVQRTRPVILTALAAVLAFIPLTHSVFWGSMAYTLIGGTAVGTVLILLFLPALYAAWFRIKPTADEIHENSTKEPELRTAMAAE